MAASTLSSFAALRARSKGKGVDFTCIGSVKGFVCFVSCNLVSSFGLVFSFGSVLTFVAFVSCSIESLFTEQFFLQHFLHFVTVERLW